MYMVSCTPTALANTSYSTSANMALRMYVPGIIDERSEDLTMLFDDIRCCTW